MAVRKHEKGAIFEENQRISNVSRIAGVRKYGAIRTLHKYKSMKVRSNPYDTQNIRQEERQGNTNVRF